MNRKIIVYVFAFMFLLANFLNSQITENKKCIAYNKNITNQKTIAPIDGEYKTPLAGQKFSTELFGRQIEVPEIDRREVMAINVGTSVFDPRIGNHNAVPFAAFYYRKCFNEGDRVLRAVISGVVNYIDYADMTWNDSNIDFLLHWENNTVPFPTSEVVEGKEIEASEIYWGKFFLGIGVGWRIPVYPYHCDNTLKIQLFYEPGYFYNYKSSKTGDDAILPPDTFEHKLHLQLRFDSYQRNIMELPHEGFAFGMDVLLARRDSWSDHRFSGIYFNRQDTRDYFQFKFYVSTVLGVPFLSERHKILAFFHSGISPHLNWDRFSAFRLGGGPNPSEANDLSRHPFPGAMFDQFIAEQYALATLEYRLELLFFLYLHFRGTLAWGRSPVLSSTPELRRPPVKSRVGYSISAAITTGFLWDSVIYVEYAYDDSVVRREDKGHGVLVSWSKSF